MGVTGNLLGNRDGNETQKLKEELKVPSSKRRAAAALVSYSSTARTYLA